MSVTEFRPDKSELARRRRILGRSIRNHLQDHAEDFAGFALVTWDNRGEAHSAFYAATGPIGQSLMPAYVHDVLNRHVAVILSEEQETGSVRGDA